MQNGLLYHSCNWNSVNTSVIKFVPKQNNTWAQFLYLHLFLSTNVWCYCINLIISSFRHIEGMWLITIWYIQRGVIPKIKTKVALQKCEVLIKYADMEKCNPLDSTAVVCCCTMNNIDPCAPKKINLKGNYELSLLLNLCHTLILFGVIYL